jgi:O-methyltransferase
MNKPLSSAHKLLVGDPNARFEFLTRLGRVLAPDYRFKWPQLDWWQNSDFNGYLKRFGELNGLNTDRHWMLGQLLRLTSGVVGDTAECGVYRGASSYLICRFNASLPGVPRTHFMFDSFLGLSEPGTQDGEHWNSGDLQVPQDDAKQVLAEFTHTVFLPGWIPERFADAETRIFSFVHIDVDLYQPTKDSIEFFYPRLQPGGILLCDDYGFGTCPGATKAMDNYLTDKPEKMLSLCSGGGFLIKGCATHG